MFTIVQIWITCQKQYICVIFHMTKSADIFIDLYFLKGCLAELLYVLEWVICGLNVKGSLLI